MKLSYLYCFIFKQSVKAFDTARKELDEMLSSVNLSYNDVDFVQWKCDVQLVAKGINTK